MSDRLRKPFARFSSSLIVSSAEFVVRDCDHGLGQLFFNLLLSLLGDL